MVNVTHGKKRFVGLVLILVCLVGCQPDIESIIASLPTSTPASTLSPTATDDRQPLLTTNTPTLAPTETTRPTETATATPTTIPTTIPPTAPPLPTSTPIGVASTNQCLTLEQTEGAVAPYKLYAANWTRPNAWDSEVYTGSTAYNMIHLGFDVEGQTAHLGKLLDVLDKHGVKTTMFVVGSWSQSYSGWIQDIASRGHEFANHTWSHANMRDLTAEDVKKELNDTERLIQQLTGKTTKPWFRPPFGSRSQTSVQAAYEAGWTHIIWSGSAEDWRQGATVERMCATLKEGAYAGSILYAHTSNGDIVEVVDRFIGEMHMKGFTFVPLSVIMSAAPATYLVPQ